MAEHRARAASVTGSVIWVLVIAGLRRRASGFAAAGWLLIAGLMSEVHGQSPPENKALGGNSEKVVLKEDYSQDLPRIAPLEIDDARNSFETLPGYRMELVASEPLVVDPVAFSFDGLGRLWVIEMIDYSEMSEEHLGRVARLVDTNGDGVMDQRTTFIEGLSWPTAIACWRDGVIVAEAPNLWFLRDTDNDGRCDQKELWSTGFQRTNVQGLVNSLRWTNDGYLHGATSSSGAELTGELAGDGLTLRGRDFQIDPLSKQIQSRAGGGQHGLSFNRWGDKFVTSNSDHLQQVLDLDHYKRAGTSYPLPAARRSIAADGPQAEVFRISPVEPWRILRTQLRVSGLVPGVVEGGGRAAGYFTGATGVCIVDRTAGYGSDDATADTAIVCDVGSNLVHRKRLVDQGLFFSGQRIDAGTELVRSRDIWFRPVQLGDGPDGCLYIADMYREVIEHPKSLPPMLKQHLDLNSGNDRGRIWRLVPEKNKPTWPKQWPVDLATNDLVKQLAAPVRWQRLTASRLLMERAANEVVSPLKEFVQDTDSADGWFMGISLLGRIAPQSLERESVFDSMRKFIKDPLFERLQEHAVAVWDHAPEAIQVTAHDDLLRLARQSSARVRLQLALSAARYSPTLRHEVIAALMQGGMHDQIPQAKSWFVFAVRNALGDSEQMAAVYLKVRQQNADAGEAWLPEVVQTLTYDLSSSDAVVQKRAQSACEQIASLTQDAKARDAVFSAVAGAGSVAIASRLLDLFGLKQADVQAEMGQKLEAFLAESDREAMGHQSTLSPALRLAKTDSFLAAVKELLHPARPTVFQAAALDAVSWRDEPAAYGLVLAAWPQLVGATKARAWSMIVEKPRGLDALELALKQKQLAVSLLNAEEQRQLREHPRPEIRNRFAKLLVAPNREELSAIVARYEPVLAKVGADGAASADKKLVQTGKAVFQRVCAACHAVNGVGVDVGPPLGGNVAEKSDSQLLLSVLDPSREVDPKFLGYTALLTDGRVISGIIVDETPEILTLSVSGGQRQPVPRGDLEQLKQTGKSLMPEGLEQQISPDEMAALFAFLRSKKD